MTAEPRQAVLELGQLDLDPPFAGPRVLRKLGKDTYVLTPYVLKGMKKARVALPSASSKTGLA